MWKRRVPLILAISLLNSTFSLAQRSALNAIETIRTPETAGSAISNEDVLMLLQAQLPSEIIRAKIQASGCNCDVSPEALYRLKDAGASDDLLVAMVEGSANAPQVPREIAIPDGTPIQIEAPYTINSMDFKPKDQISFRVVDPVRVGGVTIIEQGATATGRVEISKRGGHFGKAGTLAWSMLSVTAVDGSQVPLRVTPVRQRGDSKSAKVATRMVVTGTLLFWIAPVALMHGFKRGGNAYIPAGKRYQVVVNGQTTVRGN